jgi:hypothetical protein
LPPLARSSGFAVPCPRASGVRFVPLEDDEVEVVLMTRSGPRGPATERFAEVLRDLAVTTDLTQAG